LDGWGTDVSGARSFGDLPAEAQAYVRAIEDFTGVPVAGVGVGPGRDAVVRLRDLS
ncbi:MAG: adenylosuccinate synthase, partial [Actinophytocola sp.]|nr:adenylosuccinate synthase [Actinophytocola sp.]